MPSEGGHIIKALFIHQDVLAWPCCNARKKVEMLFAHLKRLIGLDRLRLRGPNGAKDEIHHAATVQNLRKLA